jgi:fermentation-respiration switch protein FrsA (DUF1100 family)
MSTMMIRPTREVMQEPQTETHYLPNDPRNLLHANPSRRIPVPFPSDGLTLAGHLYRPPAIPAGQLTAGLVMCGPISSVKEQTVPHYAERLADAGYTALTFDSRNYGESEGTPRHHYDPNQVIADYSNAVSYLLSRQDVDSTRVGLVGVCMGGGYAVSTAAMDKRIKAVASVGGGYNIGGTFQQFMGIEGFARLQAQINVLHVKQLATGEIQYIPTIAHGLSAEVPVAVMPNEEAYSYYDRTSKADAPNWLPNTMTAASLEPYYLYNGVVHAPLVAPTPLMIIHGTTDLFLLPEYAQQTYDAALGPKELVWIATHNHVELYDQDPYVTEAVAALLPWLERYLG